MNKLSLFLAFAALVPLALLSACSDEKSSDPTHADLCADGETYDCLIGRWKFEELACEVLTYSGSLTLEGLDENGKYPFHFINEAPGGFGSNYTGTWTLKGDVITVDNRRKFEDNPFPTGKVSIDNNGANMTITGNGVATFSQCPNEFTEIFTYIGK